MILYLQHIDIEGPETLGDFFAAKGMRSQTVALHRGEPLPRTLEGIRAVVALGGPMNVYEDTAHAFLPAEDQFIQQALAANVPFLGLCLGSQLLAKAGGGRVVKSPRREVGFFPVELTRAGRSDPLLAGVPPSFTVFQWHEDMVELPDSAVHLVRAEGCPLQGFRIGQRAYGLQFHVEITGRSIREWSAAYLHQDREAATETMLADYARLRREFDATARRIFENFWGLM